MSMLLDDILDKEDKVDLTPMIDVVFLLIIFFMVVTKMNEDKLELLTLPFATQAVPDENSGIRLIINIDKDGTVKIDGRKYKPSELSQRFEREVINKDGSLAGAQANQGSEVVVLLRADQDTQYYHIQEVIRTLSKNMIYKLDLGVKNKS